MFSFVIKHQIENALISVSLEKIKCMLHRVWSTLQFVCILHFKINSKISEVAFSGLIKDIIT